MNRLMKIYCIVFSLFLLNNISAEENINTNSSDEKSIFSTNYSYLKTSDSIVMQSMLLTYRNHRRDITWPYENEAKRAFDFGASTFFAYGYSSQDTYLGQRVLGLIGYKFSPQFQIDVSSGAHAIENKSTISNNYLYSGQIKANYNLWDNFTGYIGFNRDYAYVYLIQPGGVRNKLIVTEINSAATIRLSQDWQTRIRESYLLISDSNTKLYFDASLLYGISIDNPWLWVGIGGEKTAFKNYSYNYWSPSEFIAAGPRFEADIPIIKEFVSLNNALSYNYLWDKEAESRGKGYSISIRLTFGSRNKNNISFFYNYINSSEAQSKWYSNEFGLSTCMMF